MLTCDVSTFFFNHKVYVVTVRRRRSLWTCYNLHTGQLIALKININRYSTEGALLRYSRGNYYHLPPDSVAEFHDLCRNQIPCMSENQKTLLD